jgi:hypothetical protein
MAYTPELMIDRYNEIYERQEVIGQCGDGPVSTNARLELATGYWVQAALDLEQGKPSTRGGFSLTRHHDRTLGEVAALAHWIESKC